MGKIYTNQTALTIIVDCKVDITAAAAWVIKVKAPDGTITNMTASVVSGETTKIQVSAPLPRVFTTKGTYKLWAYVTWTGTGSAAGEPFTLNVFNEGE